jgi:ABC-type uncharacterized transport system YnjBCD ATPase subunit
MKIFDNLDDAVNWISPSTDTSTGSFSQSFNNNDQNYNKRLFSQAFDQSDINTPPQLKRKIDCLDQDSMSFMKRSIYNSLVIELTPIIVESVLNTIRNESINLNLN